MFERNFTPVHAAKWENPATVHKWGPDEDESDTGNTGTNPYPEDETEE